MAGTSRPGFFQRVLGPGPTRIALLSTGAIVVIGAVVAVVAFSGSEPPPEPEPSRASSIPPVNSLPGGPYASQQWEEARKAAANRAASEARAESASYTPPLGAAFTPEPGAPAPGTVPIVQIESRPTPVPSTPPPREPTPEEINAYKAAIAALVGSWNGKVMATSTYPTASRQQQAVRPDRYAQGPASADQTGAQPALAPAASASQRPKRVLMPGLRSVYGTVVVGGNSDQGSPPIVVQALSGPVAGLRMSGSFSRASSTNGPAEGATVKLDKITLADGRQEAINAILVAPETMDSMVASRVDPRTMERIVWPMAAAFVQGLGQGIGASGSFISTGPYGSASAFRQFNTTQLLGIGAGAAGQTAGQILREQAPRERTIYLDARSEVGIFFLSPLEVAD